MKTSKTIPLTAVLVLFFLWMAPGLVGRDLWKADEPYSFGMIYHIVQTGDWVMPTLAGGPFVEKPPLFYITAAGFARLFSPLMPLHDGARMACVFFMLLTVLFIGLTARELFGKDAAAISIIALIGSAGLQITAHKLITDIALIAGLALALYGFALSRRRYALGGFLIGTGAGIGFMSKGLLAPGLIGVIALVLPIFFAEWRKKTYSFSLLIAAVAALPWALIWPMALYLRSPENFVEWFWYQNLGRFFGFAYVGREFAWTFYLASLPWFALPTLPITLWLMWHIRRSWRSPVALQLPLTTFLVMLVILSLSASVRDIYALPLLLPLSLLASTGSGSVPERARSVINLTSVWLFSLVACVLWTGWVISVTGYPAVLAQRIFQMQPGFVQTFNTGHLIIACIYTGIWLFSVVRPFPSTHFLLSWSAGMVLAWGLIMTLWLPWLDAGSGYRAMFTSLHEKLPENCSTIRIQGLGESERALLEYYAGVLPEPILGNNIKNGDLLLIESGGWQQAPPSEYAWQLIWGWGRPDGQQGQPKEIFTLLRRT